MPRSDELKRMRDMAEKNGVSVDLPGAAVPGIQPHRSGKHAAIMLAQSPERDRDIEQMQTLIRNCAAAGIPAIKYNMSILGVLRTGRVAGTRRLPLTARGGSRMRTRPIR